MAETPKYISEALDDFEKRKAGMNLHALKWAGLPVTEANVDTIITAINGVKNGLNAAENALKQMKQDAHNTIDGYMGKLDQIDNLAIGIHQEEPKKLEDYNIKVRKESQKKGIPGKAFIESINDDEDGIGFKLKFMVL